MLSPQALGLLSMLEGPEEKGKAWPKIAGPEKDGRVCVVGAGPAGVHMALRLKEKGYTRVDLLEKTSRVGGKCEDVKHGGVPNPQGAIFAAASYFENLIWRWRIGQDPTNQCLGNEFCLRPGFQALR